MGLAVCAAAATCFALAGCSLPDDPAKVCAAPETQQEVRQLLGRTANELAAKLKEQLPSAGTDFADAQHGQAVKLDLITLTSADKTTHKIACASQASIQIAPSIAAKLKEAAESLGGDAAVMGGGQVQLAYSRQPQANGQGFVYSLDNADAANGLALTLVMNTAFEKAQASANAAQLAQAAQAAAQPPASTDPAASDTANPPASSEPAQ